VLRTDQWEAEIAKRPQTPPFKHQMRSKPHTKWVKVRRNSPQKSPQRRTTQFDMFKVLAIFETLETRPQTTHARALNFCEIRCTCTYPAVSMITRFDGENNRNQFNSQFNSNHLWKLLLQTNREAETHRHRNPRIPSSAQLIHPIGPNPQTKCANLS